MSKKTQQFTERGLRRRIRAAQKEGLAVKSIAPDGTLSFAELAKAEVSLDLSREIDALVESERAKWGDDAHGKTAP